MRVFGCTEEDFLLWIAVRVAQIIQIVPIISNMRVDHDQCFRIDTTHDNPTSNSHSTSIFSLSFRLPPVHLYFFPRILYFVVCLGSQTFYTQIYIIYLYKYIYLVFGIKRQRKFFLQLLSFLVCDSDFGHQLS